MGRPRGGQQLVGLERPVRRRPVHREERAAAHRARGACVPRICADAALRRARVPASLPALLLRPSARTLRARHAVVPGPQFGQSADHAQRPDRVSRPRAAGLAESGAGRLTRCLEGGRRRHAARSERRRRHDAARGATLGGRRQRRTRRPERP